MGHGMGKHSVGEVEEFGKTDLMALSDYLDDKPFFMGDKPTSLDASAYAMIYNFVRGPFKSAIFDFARTRSNLVDYCDRLEKQWYSEWWLYESYLNDCLLPRRCEFSEFIDDAGKMIRKYYATDIAA